MSRTSTSPRRLQSAHFAFMRALAKGLDERSSWDRYLRLEGEHIATCAPCARRLPGSEFAAATRRENRPASPG